MTMMSDVKLFFQRSQRRAALVRTDAVQSTPLTKASLKSQQWTIEAERERRSGKALGINGLPAEFDQTFWPVVGEDVLFVEESKCFFER